MARTILLVDDSSAVRETVSEVLGAEGYRVLEAENGRQALELLRKGPEPGLILLDLMMPVMDGWQFLKERATSAALSEIPVIVLSATADDELLAGTCAFLQKPMRLEVLLEALDRYYRLPDDAGKRIDSRR